MTIINRNRKAEANHTSEKDGSVKEFDISKISMLKSKLIRKNSKVMSRNKIANYEHSNLPYQL